MTEPPHAADTVAAARWTPIATSLVALCFAINMVDGMDVVIMSYIAPALATDWGVTPDALGIVFSAGLLGMAIGALALAPLADRFGRRRLILAALTLMSAGMIGSGLATDVPLLVAARVVVGTGIGTVLAAMAALVSEVAPAGRQNMAVGVVQAGYPLAAVFTGLIAAHALPIWGWHTLLLCAGIGTVLMLPIAGWILPQRVLAAAGRAKATPMLGALFGDGLLWRTLWLWVAVFAGLMVLYFIVSWIPKLAIEAGLSETNGIYAGVLYNFGAFAGTLLMSALSVRMALPRLIATLLVTAGAAMLVFGSVPMSVPSTLGVAFLIGVTLQGGYNGVWPLAASVYPAQRRATGIGWAMGIGRNGAIFGPLIGGYLLAAGSPLPVLFAVYCLPLALCAAAVLLVGRPSRAHSA